MDDLLKDDDLLDMFRDRHVRNRYFFIVGIATWKIVLSALSKNRIEKLFDPCHVLKVIFRENF